MSPVSEFVPSAQSPAAMRPAPASARPIAPITAGATLSPRKAREKVRVKSGVVFTSSTDAATDVKERLAIQVAKCRPSATPDARRRARGRGDSAGQDRRAGRGGEGGGGGGAGESREEGPPGGGGPAMRPKTGPADTA